MHIHSKALEHIENTFQEHEMLFVENTYGTHKAVLKCSQSVPKVFSIRSQNAPTRVVENT